MTLPPPLKTDRRDRRIRWILIAGAAVVALLILALGASFLVWRWRLGQELDARLAAIQAAGLPVDWEDLQRWPVEIPDEENVALLYLNALAALHNTGGLSADDLLHRADPFPDELAALAAAAVQTNSEALRMAYGITNASRSRYPVNYLDGPTARLPHLADLKYLAVVMACEAAMKAQSADAAGASQAVESSLRLSESLDHEPVLLSQLVSASILTLSSLSLERVLCRTPLSDAQLQRLQELFARADTTNRFVTALIGERALYNGFFRLAQDDPRKLVALANEGSEDGEQMEMPSRNPGPGWRVLGLVERDRNFFLRGMETNLLIVAAGPPASLSMTNEISEIDDQVRRGFHIFSRMFLPSVSGTAVRDASTRAALRTAVVALAIERWRLAHQGSPPDTLEALVPAYLPAIPLDPFDGKSLRYKTLPRGFVVYSLGANQQDDGGKEKPARSVYVPREQRGSHDITFTVER